MTDAAKQATTLTKATARQSDTTAAGEVVRLPGGNIVTTAIDPRSKAPVVAILNIRPPNGAKIMGGSDWPEFNRVLLETTLATVPNTDPGAMPTRIAAISAALAAFKPADEIDGMLAAQAVAMHNMAMECFRRAVLPNQPPDITSRLRKDGANLSRGMVDMLEALDRKRGKGPQVVRVERVVVHEGGQAIVGNVQPVAKLGEG